MPGTWIPWPTWWRRSPAPRLGRVCPTRWSARRARSSWWTWCRRPCGTGWPAATSTRQTRWRRRWVAGSPARTDLAEALVVTCVYLRQNIIEDVWADIFDGSVPRAYLLWAAAALLEAIADDASGDPDAFAVALVRDLGLAEPDRALFPALIRGALGLFERRAGQGTAEAALVAEMAGLLGE